MMFENSQCFSYISGTAGKYFVQCFLTGSLKHNINSLQWFYCSY